MKIFVYLSNNTQNLIEHWNNHLATDRKNDKKNNNLFFPEVAYGTALSTTEQSSKIRDCLNGMRNTHDLDDLVIATHSEIIFSVLRCEIKAGRINPEDFEVRWIDSNKMIPILATKDGRLIGWPNEMFGEQEKLLMELL